MEIIKNSKDFRKSIDDFVNSDEIKRFVSLELVNKDKPCILKNMIDKRCSDMKNIYNSLDNITEKPVWFYINLSKMISDSKPEEYYTKLNENFNASESKELTYLFTKKAKKTDPVSIYELFKTRMANLADDYMALSRLTSGVRYSTIIDYLENKTKAEIKAMLKNHKTYSGEDLFTETQLRFVMDFLINLNIKDTVSIVCELSTEPIYDSNLWEEKINYFGNDRSCWRPTSQYWKSSYYFSGLQKQRKAFALYIYNQIDEGAYKPRYNIIDEDTNQRYIATGRMWVDYTRNDPVFYNWYYKNEDVNLTVNDFCSALDLNNTVKINSPRTVYINNSMGYTFKNSDIKTIYTMGHERSKVDASLNMEE